MSANLKLLILAVSAALVGTWVALGATTASTQVTFLDVGQGDCAVIQHGNVNVLIDAGPAWQGGDAAERVIAPQLRRLGVTRLDMILVSHPDADHIGGLASLSRRYRPRVIVVPKAFERHPDMVAQLSRSRTGAVRYTEGEDFRMGRLLLQVRVPPLSSADNDNEGSMFVRVSQGGDAVVLTGDAGIGTELQMIKQLDWTASVLKAGHHGSRGSTGRGWLEHVRPAWVVFSCGKENRYGHPHPETLERVQVQGAQSLRTDLAGSITFRYQGGRFVPDPSIQPDP